MNHLDAANESVYFKASLNNYEIYDGTSSNFFTWNGEIIERKIGQGSINSKEWEPLKEEIISLKVEEYKTINPKNHWKEAVKETGRAYRTNKYGLWMIRLANGDTWKEVSGSSVVKPVTGPLRTYDEWHPIKEGDFYFDFKFLTYIQYLGKNCRLKDKKKKKLVVDNNSIGTLAQALVEAMKYADKDDQKELITHLKRIAGNVSRLLRNRY